MTSRRKAKRVDWYDEWPAWVTCGGERVGFDMPWYWKRRERLLRKRRNGEVEAMWGCVKKSKQQKHRGSWNLIGVDPWYGKGYISWKRD